MYSSQSNDDNNIYNANNNIYSYITSSGPSTSFTTFELFLVSTVTLGKPLLSIKKIYDSNLFQAFLKVLAQVPFDITN